MGFNSGFKGLKNVVNGATRVCKRATNHVSHYAKNEIVSSLVVHMRSGLWLTLYFFRPA